MTEGAGSLGDSVGADALGNPSSAGGAPTLTVGIISAGRVGTAIGQRLERSGHRVTHAAAASARSVNNVRTRLPGAAIATPERAASDVELIVIAVPDNQVADVATSIAPYLGPGVIVLHVAGALGRAPLAPCADAGALTLAMHPAMTFVGTEQDTDNLDGCGWGVTAADEIGLTVAELLAGQMGGRIIPIAEDKRTAYHAAMALAANLTSTIVADAADILAAVLPNSFTNPDDPAGLAATTNPNTTEQHSAAAREAAALLLGPLTHAAVTNTLSQGRAALTGPIARDDLETVQRHVTALQAVNKPIADMYRHLSRHTAQQVGRTKIARELGK